MIDGQQSPCDEGVIEAGEAPVPCPEADRPWVLAATILGSSLAFMTGSVVNVALPAMQSVLDASAADMQWVINAYQLFLGALILVGGATGDRFGRRRVFAIGTAVFTAASVGCGLAPTVGWLAGLTVPAEADPATREHLAAIVDRSFRWIIGVAAALGVGSALCAALTIPARVGEA